MMRRATWLVSLLFSGIATAQSQLPAGWIQPITAPVRDAGVLHLATHTWTRHASQVNIGLDVIYNSSCATPYLAPLGDDTYVMDGRIPSPTSPSNLSSQPGCATSYTITGFQIAYCTDQPVIPTYSVQFFEAHAGCATAIGLSPNASFVLTGLPATPHSGVQACWTVTIDLDSPPQSASLAFTMMADGDGTYGTAPDHFAWSMSTTAMGNATGPFLAGGPTHCTSCPNTADYSYRGTRWDPIVDYSQDGGGLGTLGEVRIEGGSTQPGCYFYNHCPDVSFHLRLYSNACGPITGVPFCFGDGSGTPCPCLNSSPVGNHEGCRSSLNGVNGGKLVASGSSSLSNDTLVLAGSQMPATGSVLFFQCPLRQNQGLGSPLGDGLRCAGGLVVRLGRHINVNGESTYPSGGDQPVSVRGQVFSPGTRTYQIWYRNAAAFCTGSTFNFSNGWEISWAP